MPRPMINKTSNRPRAAPWRGLASALIGLLTIAAGCAGGSPQRPASAEAGREDLSLHFGDYQSHAQLTYPAGAGRHPAVVLIHGAGPEDLDATICSPTGAVLSHNFSDIASFLTARGYAVLRYDKHGFTGPCKGTNDVPLDQLLADAATVLDTAKNDPHVDPRHVFVYGWSEGSTVAAALVTAHPEVAGLIIQSGLVGSWDQLFAYQALQVGVPYLRSLAPDGRVTADVVRQTAVGDGGLVARGILLYIATPPSTPGQYEINPRLDTNHDGVIQIDTELVPAVQPIIASFLAPSGPWNRFAPDKALPVLSAQASTLTLPELYLQGQNDANVPADDAKTFQTALASADKTLHLYPDLGHTLGPAASLIGDNFNPIATQPLKDLADWLDRHHT